MSDVTAQILLRFVAASRDPKSLSPLLAGLGLTAELDTDSALQQTVAVDAYYDVLERAAGGQDHALPIRYGESVRPEDFGALGLALKTAFDVREALERLVRYVLVLTDSLEYELRTEDDGGSTLLLLGRPHHRQGACLANEGALAAVLSLLRQITAAPLTPQSVSFGHARPRHVSQHQRFFGCPLVFAAGHDSLRFDDVTLATRTRLGDAGLSAFLLAHLDGVREQMAERSIVSTVRRAVAESLSDGPPKQARIARRLGMSERTLHRRLAEGGQSFRTIAEDARRALCESLLANPTHSLAEVAFLTGFSEQSAFQRAFKRWSGQTPKAYRNSLTRPAVPG